MTGSYSPPASGRSDPIRFRRWALALLPVFPPLVLLGWLGVSRIRLLPRWVLLLVCGYVATQLLSSLWAPQPGLALLGAGLRSALIVGLLGLGSALSRLGGMAALKDMRWGLIVVYLTALLNGLALQGWDLTQLRLSHPYYTPISLGLVGALGVWIALSPLRRTADASQDDGRSEPGRLINRSWVFKYESWRLPLAGLGLLTTLLSGSRGPLGILLLGAAWMLSRHLSLLKTSAVLGGILLVTFTAGRFADGTVLQRLLSVDVTGRDLIWDDTLSVIRAFPLSGVGSYLTGPRIAPPGLPCVWFEALEVRGVSCPAVIEQLNGVWLISHNGLVQQFAESGIFGVAGLYLLLGAIVAAAVRSRSALAQAIVLGSLVGDLTDNVLLLPGPPAAVTFWLVGGWLLAGRLEPASAELMDAPEPRVSWTSAALWGTGILIVTAFPLWARILPSGTSVPGTPGISGLINPPVWRSDEPYAAAARFVLPPGEYRAQLRGCEQTCVTIKTVSFAVSTSGQGSVPWVWLSGPFPAPGQVGASQVVHGTSHELNGRAVRMELKLWSGRSAPWRLRPIGQVAWSVHIKTETTAGQP